MRPKLTLILWTLCALAAPACSPKKTSAESPMKGELKRREPTRVLSTPVVEHEMVRTLTTTTNVESEKEIEVFPRATGVVAALLVEEGDRVTEGQPLAVLDQRDAQASLDEARMSMREAEEGVPKVQLSKEEAVERQERAKLTWQQAVRDVERNEEGGLISDNDLDQLRLTRDQAYRDLAASKVSLEVCVEEEKGARTAIDRAKLAVDREELNFSYTEITAPFDGVIATRTVKVGDSVSPSMSAFVLTDTDNLRAVFFRPQRELPLFRAAHVSNGSGTSPVEIHAWAEAIPGVEFDAHIELVSPTIDASSGSFRVTIGFGEGNRGDEQAQLLPGMLVRLGIVTERHPDALVVPKRALRREGDSTFLFTIEDGLAHRVTVDEGFSNDEEVEVLPIEPGSLVVGDEVAVVGNRDLEEGSEVKAEPWGETERADDTEGAATEGAVTDDAAPTEDEGTDESSESGD